MKTSELVERLKKSNDDLKVNALKIAEQQRQKYERALRFDKLNPSFESRIMYAQMERQNEN